MSPTEGKTAGALGMTGTDPSTDSTRPTEKKPAPKKKKVSRACYFCRWSHMCCDGSLPCKRCVSREIPHLCYYEGPVIRRKQPNGSEVLANNHAQAVQQNQDMHESNHAHTIKTEPSDTHQGLPPAQAMNTTGPLLNTGLNPSLNSLPGTSAKPWNGGNSFPPGKADLKSLGPDFGFMPPLKDTVDAKDLAGLVGDASAIREPFPQAMANYKMTMPQPPQAAPTQAGPSDQITDYLSQLLRETTDSLLPTQPTPTSGFMNGQSPLQNGQQPLMNLQNLQPLQGVAPYQQQAQPQLAFPHPSPLSQPQGSQSQPPQSQVSAGSPHTVSNSRPSTADTTFVDSANLLSLLSDSPPVSDSSHPSNNSGLKSGEMMSLASSAQSGPSFSSSTSYPTQPNPTNTGDDKGNLAIRVLGPVTRGSFGGGSTNVDNFFLTTLDQKDGLSPADRLSHVIYAKFEAGLMRPYDYVAGYNRLMHWMDENMSLVSKQETLRLLSKFKPIFGKINAKLTDLDLLIKEEKFERLSLEYDRVFMAIGIPSCLWRRTGEIFKANQEFASLVGVPLDSLKDGRLAIYNFMTEDSVVNYWQEYGKVAFDANHKAVLTSCILIDRNKAGRNQTHATPNAPNQIPCCCSFTIRRDDDTVPSMIIGNFLRM